ASAQSEETEAPITKNTAIPAPTEHIAPEMTITGQTTFQEVLDWGVPRDVIENILSKPLPNTQTIIKDYVVELGLLFSNVKTRLQSEVDRINWPKIPDGHASSSFKNLYRNPSFTKSSYRFRKFRISG
ncbi:MAG: hypothetical protein AAGU05_10375, partial [Anaerolineaceae bacterium]